LSLLYPDVDWQPVAQALKNADCIHIVAHVTPDADTIGSQLALFHALKSLGKHVVMHNMDSAPRICQYLQGSEYISHGACIDGLNDIDVVVAVDAGSLGRLGFGAAYFSDKTLINIDHHASNTMYGNINLIDARYCATGAMIYDLLQCMGIALSAESSAAIYAAVLTDTASFRLSTVTADVHRMVADLIDAGADVGFAATSIYQSHHKGRFDILQLCLKEMEICDDGHSAWLWVEQDWYAQTGTRAEDTEGFIDYARSIEGVEVAAFLRADGEDVWKLSLRGQAPYHVGQLAAALGGGGHQYAAGVTLLGTRDEVTAKVKRAVSELFNS